MATLVFIPLILLSVVLSLLFIIGIKLDECGHESAADSVMSVFGLISMAGPLMLSLVFCMMGIMSSAQLIYCLFN